MNNTNAYGTLLQKEEDRIKSNNQETFLKYLKKIQKKTLHYIFKMPGTVQFLATTDTN